MALVVGGASSAIAHGSAGSRARTSVTRNELRTLAIEALTDTAALARLREVTSVDGRPVDLRTALAGAAAGSGQLRNRLRTLAGLSPGVASVGGAGGSQPPASTPTTMPAGRVDPAAARTDAQRVLRQRRYRPGRTPAPLRGVLRWIGDRAKPVTDPIGHFFEWLFRPLLRTPLGRVVTVVVLLVLTIWLALWLARRRGRAAVGAGQRVRLHDVSAADPAELDQQADEAERAGDLERALRLRFAAGLARLHRAGVLERPVDGPNGELAVTLASPRFDELAHTFDEVVYGRRPAEAGDLDEARRDWPAVLAEARR